MKRGRNTVLKIVRIWVLKHQQEIAASINTDQSTVSRIESGELYVTPDVEWDYVVACGGVQMLRMLIDHLQSLLDRLTNNHNRLMPA